ncbi:unnamed protein product [Rhodiola kirilowii]
MYKVAAWNVKGLNNPYKKNEILRWIQKNKLDVTALLEVKLKENKWGDAVKRCSPDEGWKAEFSTYGGDWARIMLLWNEATTKILNIQKFYHFVVCEVVTDNKRFGLIVVYTSNNPGERTIMWEEIEKVGDKFPGSWMCIRDFNCVKDQRKKMNGNRVRDQETADFRRFLHITGLVDLPASGSHLTWSNNHINPNERIWSKLDRALGNSVWFDEMEEARAIFPSPGISDHCLVIVQWGQEERIKKNFRYCNFWENLEEYEEIIRSLWSYGNKCRNLFMIQAKLKYMKYIMKQRLVGSTRGMDKRVNQIREAILEAQRKSESKPQDAECCLTERKLAMEFRKVKGLKPSGLKKETLIQNSSTACLRTEDVGTTLFKCP